MVSKDTLIDYLLHQMPESERLDFAEKWFADAEFCEQLETAEAELLDAYVRAQLPRGQRARVERYLLSSEGQRRKLEFAAALHGALPARSRPPIWWVSICAAAVLLVLAGAMFTVARKNQELSREIALLRSEAKPLAGGVYATSLTSSVRGSTSGSPVVLPKDTVMVRLELELGEGEDRGGYAASLSRSGTEVWKEEPLGRETRGPASLVSFWIPAQFLQPGNYSVALASGGEPVAYYSLVVQGDHRAP